MNIYESIAACMADIGAVGKTSQNKQQGFMFRGIDAVMNAINPALTKNKVFIVPEILEQKREERTTTKGAVLIYSICTVKYTFYAEDGSHIECIVIGEGMDSGDKATNKAMSIAYKYACFQVFCIPTEEMKNDDPDLETQDKIKSKAETTKTTQDNNKTTSDNIKTTSGKLATERQIELIKNICADMGGEMDEEEVKKWTMERATEFIKKYSKK